MSASPNRLILAAGRSERFGDADKLAQDIGGRPLLMRTVELFTKREEVRSILVAGPPDSLEDFKNRYGASLGFHGARIVEGGRAERWESVRNALGEAPDCSHIAVHDAARPVVSKSLLDRLFQAAKSLAAVVPAIQIAATVKRVTQETTDVADRAEEALADAILGEVGRQSIHARKVCETIDRQGLVEVQTPQIFQAELLRRAYEQDKLDGATDDAMLVERLGEAVHVIDGDRSNIKVTTQGDLKLVRALLGVRPPADRPVHKRF